jgi:imidazolonepropionase
MNMACVLFRLTPHEALAGATINAARALGLADQVGSIEIGKFADLALWQISRPAELAYSISGLMPKAVVFLGALIAPRS